MMATTTLMGLALWLAAAPASGVAATPAAFTAAGDIGGGLAALEREQQALFDAVAPSVIFIRCGDGFGSGFFVREDGLALTNAHVVGECPEVNVVLLDGRRFTAKVVERATGNADLAVVQVPVAGVRALVLDALADVRVGSFAASIGHGKGAIWTFNVGMISNIHPVGAEHPVLQTQIPLNPGNSGGPIVDRKGKVIGIVTAGIKESNAINFAIRADYAARALNALAALTGQLVVNAPEAAQVFLDGAIVGLGPRVAVACAAGAHEVMVVAAGKMSQKRVECPKEQVVTLP